MALRMMANRVRRRPEYVLLFVCVSFVTFTFLPLLILGRQPSKHLSSLQAARQGPVVDRTDPLEVFVIDSLIHDYKNKDAMDVALRMRIFKQTRPGSSMHTYFMRVHLKWLLKITQPRDLLDRWQVERGVVICTGNDYFRLTVHLIRVLRYHGCRLPIEVHHMGPNDLKPSRQRYINGLSNVRTVDLKGVFGVTLEGWDTKPFALLASRFKKVILMDADVVFLESPEGLFDDRDFAATGALFFRDRSLYPYSDPDELYSRIFPWPHSRELQSNPISQQRTRHLQESGVLVVDKPRHVWGLLMVCLLNQPYQRLKGTIKDYIHGDKETFWMGLELMGERYSFMPFTPGSIGKQRAREVTATVGNSTNATQASGDEHLSICGKLLHFDRDGEPFWFNDSILDQKHGENYDERFYDFESYAVEGSWSPFLCLDSPLQPLTPRLLAKLDSIKRLYLPGPDQHLKNLLASFAGPVQWLTKRKARKWPLAIG